MEKLRQEIESLLGIQMSAWQLNAFERYTQLLLKWNAIHNLTAIREPQQIRSKHFLDSITCVLAMRGTPVKKLIDIGTGAGFPGLILKIIYPDSQVTLVESVAKKLDFCRMVLDELDLADVNLINSRAEDVGQMETHREQYDWAVARAVAVMPVLVEYLLPVVRLGGRMLAMKGSSAPHETQSAEKAIQLLGGRIRQLIPITLPGVVEERYLVVVDKIAATPPAYPRRAGTPSKHPLHHSIPIAIKSDQAGN